MDFKALFCLACALVAAAGAEVQNSKQCNNTEVWNADLEECISCSICQKYPKTLSCDACVKEAEHSTNIWMVVALVSFSLVTILLAMGIGVLVHHCKSRSDKPLREPIEETTGPLYAIV
ncbi:uncharacterized protein si:rp71-1c10.7 isoform X2 [Lepisosteus oculatus]|uniref:uncharacterized protein si:rp71-1c10.7 isoform X2 n=1 Tax=Lepisosteus oculatus TaxID=7918 RepID=UPI00073FAD52|nr:PREDICTED: tumor necrosis factor receptor superfamily member 12A isoform X2 [Lepisosteus oculatus]